MKRFGLLMFAVLLSTASFAEVKELTCTQLGNSRVSYQLTLNEAAGTVHFEYAGQPTLPAVFTEESVTWTWDTDDGHNLTPHVFHYRSQNFEKVRKYEIL